MNDFSKIYSLDELKRNKIVTLLSLPLEESIMVPVSQAIHLMKHGENVVYFSLNHDSIKINEFFKAELKNELHPETITGNLAVIDSSQIPSGMDWASFIENQISIIKNDCPLNVVLFDVFTPGSDENQIAFKMQAIAFSKNITALMIKTIKLPIFTANQNSNKNLEMIDLMMNKTFQDMMSESMKIVQASDLVIGIKRQKESFWKKIVNFLLFWRKKNNFALKVLKNRTGKDGSFYKMNIDFESSKIEIL